MATAYEAEIIKKFNTIRIQSQWDSSPITKSTLLSNGFSEMDIALLKKCNCQIAD